MVVRTVTPIRAYVVAVLVFLAAALLRLAIDPWLGRSVPYLLFFPAIIVATRYGGFGPGILVTVLSGLTAIVLYLEPLGTLAIHRPADLLSLVLFGAVGVLIARLSNTVRLAEADQWLLAAIAESSDDAIVGKDVNGIVTSWNRGAERLFGFASAEAIGKSIMLIVPDDRVAEEEDVLRRLRAGQRIAPLETTRRRKDGTEVEVSLTISPISDRSGVVVGASKIARDITERRRIERQQAELVERQLIASDEAIAARDRLAFLSEVSALLSSSLHYEETLDRAVHLALPRLGDYCNVLVADDRGRLHHAAWGHVDRAKEPLLKELARRLFDSDDGAQVTTFASHVMKTGQRMVVSHAMLTDAVARLSTPVTKEVRELGEALRAYAYVGVPLQVRGHAAGVMSFGTTVDGSQREYIEADLQLVEEFARRVSVAVENARLFRQAEELNRLKDEFLATLSHELRTPLSAVLGWSRMLASGQLDPAKAKHATEAIERNAQAQARIVEDLLDVAQGTGGNLRLDVKPFDLVLVANRAMEAVSPAAIGKQIHVDLRAPAPVTIVGDPSRLQQVMWNLLSNALKFTPSGGRVSVDVVQDDGHAELRVTDSGIGISPSFLPYVFDKFRQADASFTRQHGGLGLGLAIARHLTELHGGSIEARSAGEGSGATFVVRLPLPARTD